MSGARAPLPLAELTVLHERGGLLFVDKPAGLQTEPDARTRDTLVTRIATQLAIPAERVHALSRLDTGVSGVVTLGLTGEACRQVQAWRTQGRFERRYLALASGAAATPAAPRGSWSEPIGRAAGSLRSVSGRNPEAAQTDYAVIASSERRERATPSQLHVLALGPRTGRTHQLRVHSAAHGMPLLGDRAYGGDSRWVSASGAVHALDRVALHAAWVELPFSDTVHVESPTPPALLEIWREFSGTDASFQAARDAVL